MIAYKEHSCDRLNLSHVLPVVLATLLLTGCSGDDEPRAAAPRPVRTVQVEMSQSMDPIVLSGRVEARNEAALAFRIAGRMVERPVNVGDVVAPGQVVARLDPQNELNALSSAPVSYTHLRAHET